MLRAPLPPSPAGPPAPVERRLAIDLLRGLAVVVMVLDHLVGHSWFHMLTLGTLYITAAEGFVLCSGLALGWRSRERFLQAGHWGAIYPVLRRTLVVWGCASGSLLAVGTLAMLVPGAGRPAFTDAPPAWGELARAALSLQLAPPLLDILPMYVGLLGLTPLLIAGCARGHWPFLVLASLLAWGWNWCDPYALSTPPLDRDGRTYFSLASWQIIYVGGFLVAWYGESLKRRWAWVPPHGWWLSLAVIGLSLAVASFHDSDVRSWPLEAPERATWLAATDRSLLGPIRLLAVMTYFPLLSAALSWLTGFPSTHWLHEGLLLLGRNALLLYMLHLPLVLFWSQAIAPWLGGRVWLTSLGQAAALLLLWGLVRQRHRYRARAGG
ncbi:MAG: OpgC domain-containing protein [Candidatus Sericytochromatia bacterium]|nr:OpgC domain-containing protein [Candidatus Sericytochromatia bacterium]